MQDVTLKDYADNLFGGEDGRLRTLRREAEEQGIPMIQVPTDLARLLVLLITQTQARNILEIGTLFGYSSIVMARAMPSDGRIVTLEVNARHAEVARRNMEQLAVADRITVVDGPALQSLEALRDRIFDLVFIDADKDSYPDYLEEALKVTRPGSIIVADNVWRQGAVADASSSDSSATAMAAFNRALAGKDSLVSTFVPTRNGEDAASVSVVRSPA